MDAAPGYSGYFGYKYDVNVVVLRQIATVESSGHLNDTPQAAWSFLPFSSVVAVVVVPNIGVLGHNRCTLDGILSLSPQLQNVCGLENFPRASINTPSEQYMGEIQVR